jgi:peptidoglycan/LPS O-acetylase OafA/YrhL
VSIVLVLICHSTPALRRAGLPNLANLVRESRIGVDVFFVISGFLITLLLLRESDREGSISLRGFYSRRALRILPALAAYLAFVAALALAGVVRTTGADWLAVSTCTINWTWLFRHHPPWQLGHLWSLSVEEHFYLIWPAALAWLGRRRAAVGLIIVVAISPTIRFLLWAAFPADVSLGLIKISTVARLDGIGAGALLAFLAHDRGLLSRRPQGRVAVFGRVAAGFLIVSNVLYTAAGFFEIAARESLKSAAIAGLIALVVFRPRSATARLLEARPMVALGALSYSLYLWQQPFLVTQSRSPLCRWPANIPLAFACAVASYLLVERPFLRLKDRLRRPAPALLPRPHLPGQPATRRGPSRRDAERIGQRGDPSPDG